MKCNIICNFAAENSKIVMNELPPNDIKKLYQKVTGTKKIVIVSHIHPDGDAVGSCVAMLSWLKSIGSGAKVILPQRYPECTDFLIEEGIREDIVIFDQDKEKASRLIRESEIIIFQDINEPARTGEMGDLLITSPAEKILIDHHLGPRREDFVLCFSETEISSACELLYYILKQMPGVDGKAENLPRLSATALMAGMTTDTNNFANSVYPSTMTMASELIAAGVDRDAILGYVFNSYNLTRIQALGYLLDRCLHVTADGVAYIILSGRTSRKFALQDGDTEGFVNMPLTIGCIRMSIFLKEERDRFRVSIRSKRGTSANRCAVKYFHGGGHELASGGRLMKPEDVKCCREAAEYIERVTHEFFIQENDI